MHDQDHYVSPDAHRSDREEPPPAFEDERSNMRSTRSDIVEQGQVREPEPEMEDQGENEEQEPEPQPELEREPSVHGQFSRPPSPEEQPNPIAPESVVFGCINPSASPSQKMLLRQCSWYGHSDGRSTVAAMSNVGDRPMSLVRSMSARSFDQLSRNRSAPVPMSGIVYQSTAPSNDGGAGRGRNIEGLTSPMQFETPVPRIAEYLNGMEKHAENGEIDEMEISDVGTHQN